MLKPDCSPRAQAPLTLSAGFSCTVPEPERVLLSLDIEQIYESAPSIMDNSKCYLREEVCEMPGEPRALTSAYWFHATRTFSDTRLC